MTVRHFFFFAVLVLLVAQSSLSMQGSKIKMDSIPVNTNPDQASEYLRRLINDKNIWANQEDTLRLSIGRLLYHFTEPFDSVRVRLEKYPFGKIDAVPTTCTATDSLPVRWLNRTTFIVDTAKLDFDPFVTKKTIITRILGTTNTNNNGSTNLDPVLEDYAIKTTDTIVERILDTEYLKTRNVTTHVLEGGRITPPIVSDSINKTARLSSDLTRVIISEQKAVFAPTKETPFLFFDNNKVPDSLANAVASLLEHTLKRDSILIYLNDLEGRRMPLWLTTGSDEFSRYWARNSKNDSISLWIGNLAYRELVVMLENEVFIERPSLKKEEQFSLSPAKPQRSLAPVKPLKEITKYWKHVFAGSLTLNQNYLSNWARGGTSSISGLVDLLVKVDYNNTDHKTLWENSAQLRFGTLRTKENDRVILRTSTDILEVNSKFNKQLLGKFDFSGIIYFRTQVAKAFKQPENTELISKFLNPATFTVGMGFEYKPFEGTSINYSMLSYRNTFVLDTLNVNQTSFGIDKEAKSRQEMGGQLLIKNIFNVTEGLKINNSLRLFSNYLRNPEKVDVNWELGVTQRISWFFSVRFNFHLIYDDKVRFPVVENGEPVLLPDGSPKLTPKAQINQLLGLTLALTL